MIEGAAQPTEAPPRILRPLFEPSADGPVLVAMTAPGKSIIKREAGENEPAFMERAEEALFGDAHMRRALRWLLDQNRGQFPELVSRVEQAPYATLTGRIVDLLEAAGDDVEAEFIERGQGRDSSQRPDSTPTPASEE